MRGVGVEGCELVEVTFHEMVTSCGQSKFRAVICSWFSQLFTRITLRVHRYRHIPNPPQ